MNVLSFWYPHTGAVVWGVNVILQITVVTTLALVAGSCLQRNAVARHGVLFSALSLALIIPFSAAVLQHVGFGTFSVAVFAERSSATDNGVDPPTKRERHEQYQTRLHSLLEQLFVISQAEGRDDYRLSRSSYDTLSCLALWCCQ